MRILLVDDHAIFRQGLRTLLENEDDSLEIVGEAGNGIEALTIIEKQEPDLVIMDISMPGLNGLEATNQIRERFPHTKVIILSRYLNKMYVTQALKAGASGYINKEAVFEEVKVALEAVKKNKRYLSPSVLDPVIEVYIKETPPSKTMSTYHNLSVREREILQLLAEGRKRRELAEILKISPKTVDTHKRNLLKKLQLKDVKEIKEFVKKMDQPS